MGFEIIESRVAQNVPYNFHVTDKKCEEDQKMPKNVYHYHFCQRSSPEQCQKYNTRNIKQVTLYLFCSSSSCIQIIEV